MAAPPKPKTPSRTPRRRKAAPQARALEWGFGVGSAILVVLLLGYLAYQGIRTQNPPGFALEVRQVERVGTAYQVSVEVRNTGDSTAADVAVRGVAGGGEPETSETVLDFLPPRSARQAVLLFTRDPADRLTLSVRAYTEP